MSTEQTDTFHRFSPQARAVLVASQRYAEAMHEGLGSEHMLLALTVTPDSAAYGLLRKIPVTLDQLRLVLRLESGKHESATRSKGMTTEAKAILERAALHAATLGAVVIEAEHLLWAMTSEKRCTAYHIIQQLGVEPKTVRKAVERFLHDAGIDRPILSGHEIEVLGIVGQSDDQAILFDPAHKEELARPHEEVGETEAAPTLLEEHTTDVTRAAGEHQLDPIIGRERELERIVHILGRKSKNNPVLIGDPGVGKTAIVEGLAQRLHAGTVPADLQGSRLLALDLGSVVAGTMYRGQFEDRLKRILGELAELDRVILFIDEIHTLIGAGGAEGTLDAANILKPLLAKGGLRVIGATTTAEYQKYIERDTALERRLQPILVPEPTPTETLGILKGLKHRYEEYHGVTMTDTLLRDAIELARRYVYDRRFPDKAIDLVDEAASMAKARRPIVRKKLDPREALLAELQTTVKEKEAELKAGNLTRAAFLRDQEVKLRLREQHLSKEPAPVRAVPVTEHDIREVISRWTGVPAERLARSDRLALLGIEKLFKTHIVGQDAALTALAEAIRRAKSGLKHPHRPVGSFLFIGPTGVGKTEVAKTLAREFFGDEAALVKLDMSEYMERHQVSRLLGAPPGYVGHDTSTSLLDTIRRRPYSVVLFDEIEKAHPDVFHLLLQILEDGVLTDGRGRQIHFHETIVILTSNLGSSHFGSQAAVGFSRDSRQETQAREAQARAALKARFQPELLARLDQIIYFQPLSRVALAEILHKELQRVAAQLAEEDVRLTVTPRLAEHLLAELMESGRGARDVRHLVLRTLATPLATYRLRWPHRSLLKADYLKQSLTITGQRPANHAPHSRRVRHP
ncbi:ATP-dependent Clp protease ATP-binding subunit [Candidatus Berkelbacteria bacterium]|nr:ATP-dependent Clp protease ATP-binding subunit [Candidatus Berkelbacteria bacterium]